MKDFCHCLFPSALLSSVLVSWTVRHSLHVGKGLPRGSIYQFSNPGVKYLFLCISNNVRAHFHCSVWDTCPSLSQSLPLWSSRPRPGTQSWSQLQQTGEWEGNFKGKLVCCYLSAAGGDSWQAIKYPLHWHRLPSFKFFPVVNETEKGDYQCSPSIWSFLEMLEITGSQTTTKALGLTLEFLGVL